MQLIDPSTSIAFALFLMTSKRHFQFPLPEEMDGLIDYFLYLAYF